MTEVIKYKKVFTSNGKYYIFESDSFEPKERFNRRAWFIIKYIENNNNNNNLQIQDIINLSRKWINEQTIDAIY
jgi:hypothetical protein